MFSCPLCTTKYFLGTPNQPEFNNVSCNLWLSWILLACSLRRNLLKDKMYKRYSLNAFIFSSGNLIIYISNICIQDTTPKVPWVAFSVQLPPKILLMCTKVSQMYFQNYTQLTEENLISSMHNTRLNMLVTFIIPSVGRWWCQPIYSCSYLWYKNQWSIKASR